MRKAVQPWVDAWPWNYSWYIVRMKLVDSRNDGVSCGYPSVRQHEPSVGIRQ